MMTQIDEQIAKLQNQRNQVKISFDDKSMQVRKYDELIMQSEGALNTMISNTQKLNSALNSALDENKL